MINLLPNETKRSIRAARTNVLLRRYVIFLIIATLFMVAIFAFGYVMTTSDHARAKQELARIEAESARYSETKQEAEEFSKNLGIAKSILSGEIMFSEVILDIASTLPRGTVLTDLNIDTNSLGKEMVLNARTTDAEGGLRLKAALENSKLFEKVSIQTITNPTGPGGGGGAAGTSQIVAQYPYIVILNVTLVSPQKAVAAPAQGGITP